MKRLFRSSNFSNSFWNLLDVIIYPVVFLAVTPFFISRMGETEFGLWMLVNSVLVTFQLMNFGLGTATQRNVARFRGRNEPSGMYDSINTNLSLALLLMLLCLFLGVCLYIGVLQFNLFQLEFSLQPKAALLMLLASGLVSLKFMEQIFQYALKGSEDFKTAAWLNSCVRFSILGSNMALVAAGFDLSVMLSVNIGLTVLWLFLHLFMLKRIIPGYRLQIRWDKEKIREELRYGFYTWVQSVAVILAYQLDRFLVATVYGLETLSYYSIVATMFNHIHMMFNALIPWMLPKVARLREKGKNTLSLFLSARAFLVISGVLLLLIFYWLSGPVFTIWLGQPVYLQVESYIRLFVIFELFFLFTGPAYYFMNASGEEKRMTWITLLITVLAVAGMLAGTALSDRPEGILYGLIAGTIIGIICENSLINISMVRKNWIREGLLILIPSALTALLVMYSSPMLLLAIFPCLLLSIYLLFIRTGEFNLKLLLLG